MNTAIISAGATALQRAGQVANRHAQDAAFADFLSRKAQQTLRAHRQDLSTFSAYLTAVGLPDVPNGAALQTQGSAWTGVTWGLVEGFRHWLLQEGAAIATLNRRLATVKKYAQLAMKAGILTPDEILRIKAVAGYGSKEGKRIDAARERTRTGPKKAEHVSLSLPQVQALKRQPETPQGPRDALLMALLLDHGLRVGEVALVEVSHFDLKEGLMRFYRPKVDKEQTHKLSADTLRALRKWVESGDCVESGPLLRASCKGGQLTAAGMTERSITRCVRLLGRSVGVSNLDAHDCRHFWATFWAGKVDLFRLQEAGGWNSLTMPRRYTEWAAVANEGMA